MNFDLFAEKLKASAAQAAAVAKQFEGLDAMAAQDDYIHREEFNVSGDRLRREAAAAEQQRQQQQQQQQVMEQQSSNRITTIRPHYQRTRLLSNGDTRPVLPTARPPTFMILEEPPPAAATSTRKITLDRVRCKTSCP